MPLSPSVTIQATACSTSSWPELNSLLLCQVAMPSYKFVKREVFHLGNTKKHPYLLAMSSFLNSQASYPIYDSTHYVVSFLFLPLHSSPLVGRLLMPRSLSNIYLIIKPTGHLLVLTFLDLSAVIDSAISPLGFL